MAFLAEQHARPGRWADKGAGYGGRRECPASLPGLPELVPLAVPTANRPMAPFAHPVRNHAMTTPDAFPLEAAPIHVSDEVLDDLRARLALTRPPLDEGNGDWSYGVPDSYLRELVTYWRDDYDWRTAEAAINGYEHYQVSVAGVPVHFMRKPARGPRPIPLILTHGWPWTFWHWSKVIDPLADPGAYGGALARACDGRGPALPS